MCYGSPKVATAEEDHPLSEITTVITLPLIGLVISDVTIWVASPAEW